MISLMISLMRTCIDKVVMALVNRHLMVLHAHLKMGLVDVETRQGVSDNLAVIARMFP